MTKKNYVLTLALTGLLGATGSAAAGEAVKAPIRLTDAQMEKVVAGATVDTVVYQGYSSQPQHSPNGQGTSSVTTETTTTPGCSRCIGSTATATATTQVSTSGPGKSPSSKILGLQGRL